MVCKQYIVLNHVLSEKTASFPKPFASVFPAAFPTEFPAAFPTEFPKLDADWFASLHAFKMLNFHQSLPC